MNNELAATLAESSFMHEIQELTFASQRIQWSSIIDAGRLMMDADHVITIGVGKSAFMAKRMSASLTSIGIKSVFLHPIDALHGDIGIVGKNDIIIIFSNSGNTEEIVSIIPFLKMRSKAIIGIIGNIESVIAKQSDVFVDASITREGCPLNIVPTTSLLMATAISNALIVGIMNLSQVTKDDFAHLHPAGQLGRNLLLTVESVMIKGEASLPFVHPEASLKDLIIIMSERRLGCAIISEDNNEIVGFITDGDVRRCLSNIENLINIQAKDIMSSHPITVKAESSLGEALSLMEDRENKIGVLPVIDTNGQCIGVVRLHDIAGHIR
jgi:arabinose-5-phosphate isomerase